MSEKNTGGPVFPTQELDAQGMPRHELEPGMTLRQYAAIKLRVPDSGTDWLDDMITASIRNEMAAKAMQSLVLAGVRGDISYGNEKILADRAYEIADAMAKAGEA